MITVTTHQSETDTYTDYTCGPVVIGTSQHSAPDLIMHRTDIPGPITRALLVELHHALGCLLADSRIVLPDGDAPEAPTHTGQHVRVRGLLPACRFDTWLTMQLAARVSKQADALGLTRKQVNDVALLIATQIEEAFASTAEPLPSDSPSLLEHAYSRGYQDALAAIRDLLEARRNEQSARLLQH